MRTFLGFPRVVAVHKPREVVVSRVRERGSPTLFERLPQPYQSWYAVGRLDKDSEGLLLLVNDPWLAQHWMNPGVLAKRYWVTVEGFPDEAHLDVLRRGGIDFWGRRSLPAQVRRMGKAPRGGTRLEVVLHEGINRQIRRSFQRIGHRVRRLRRIAVGPIELDGLGPGEFRELSREEVGALVEAVGAPVRRGEAREKRSRSLMFQDGEGKLDMSRAPRRGPDPARLRGAKGGGRARLSQRGSASGRG